jgi:dihydrodipicolinate reductase
MAIAEVKNGKTVRQLAGTKRTRKPRQDDCWCPHPQRAVCGILARRKVRFGTAGQTLSIIHDTTCRDAICRGCYWQLRKVINARDWVYGLDTLLGFVGGIMKGYRVAIVGATGMVGKEFIKVLELRNFL